MDQQMRFNDGKPVLSYFYTNARAMDTLIESPVRDYSGGFEMHDGYADVVLALNYWLARDYEDDHLTGSFWACLWALQVDADGILPRSLIDQSHTAVQALSHFPEALAAYCEVCVRGAAKYARGNYRKGAPVTQYADSALRHLNARLTGHAIDADSGKLHGAHVLWNIWQIMDQPRFRDDRLPRVDQAVSEDAVEDTSLDMEAAREILEGARKAFTMEQAHGFDANGAPVDPLVDGNFEERVQNRAAEIAREHGLYAANDNFELCAEDGASSSCNICLAAWAQARKELPL